MNSVEEVKRVIADKKRRAERRKKVTPKPFPSNVTLDDIIKSLPSEVFKQSRFKSYGSLIVTLLVLATSMYLLAVCPWYLWPVGWFLGGISVTGLFSIAHDCAHRSFSRSRVVNYIVGTIAMLPLGYSFESWKVHHKYRHMLYDGVSKATDGQLTNHIWKWAKGKTFWLASIGHQLEQHFDMNLFNPQERLRVRVSLIGLYAVAAAFFSFMFYYVGLVGIVKYWLLPWLLYHFFVSTTTLLPSLVVEEKSKWIAVHCDYPKWLEFLCNDITLALPRNISTSIPHYNLRKAYKSLKQQWGEYFVEIRFEMGFLSDLMSTVPPQSFTPTPHDPVFPEEKNASGPVPVVTPQESALKSFSAFFARINWLHVGILVPTPIIAIYGLFNFPITLPTLIWSFVYYYLTGFGITGGYHRLFAHRAYSTTRWFRFVIMMLGSGAVEGSVRWWCRDHRAHHRYTDTDKDPYNAHEGFWWSHMGWMLHKQIPGKIGRANIDDLSADPMIMWQHRNYIATAVFMGIIFPTLVAGLGWGDWAGGYFFAAVLRLVFVHHSTFMVNSLAHYIGAASFADNHTPRDSVITAFLTLGEGYHNFHHEFPQDYRNAIYFYQYDPTKWTIKFLSYFGITYDLKMFPENEIIKGQVQMAQKNLDAVKKTVDWGLTEKELPLINKEIFDEVAKEGYKLCIVDNIVHDITDFIDDHPGGKAYIESGIGKDITRQFNGGVYAHSNGAHNLLSEFRVARVDPSEWAKSHAGDAAAGTVLVDEAAAAASKKLA